LRSAHRVDALLKARIGLDENHEFHFGLRG
jgi:hypothetical protein